MLPKPEEVPKKPKSRGENLAKTGGGTKKNQKNKVPEVLGPGGLKNFGFFGTSSGLARFSGKILPEPEEVPKKPKSRDENLAKT